MTRRLSKDDIISNIYYDLENDFGSIDETLRKAKEQDPSINRVDVSEWMKKQPNKQIRRYRGSNSYTAPFARYEYEYQIDIMDMKPLTKTPEVKVPVKNGEPRYGLVVIDIFSKLANVVPMKNASTKPTPIETKHYHNNLNKTFSKIIKKKQSNIFRLQDWTKTSQPPNQPPTCPVPVSHPFPIFFTPGQRQRSHATRRCCRQRPHAKCWTRLLAQRSSPWCHHGVTVGLKRHLTSPAPWK